MKKNKILLWGDLCIDRNNIEGKELFGPGGAVYFCAKIFQKFGWQPVIVSPRGKDYDIGWIKNISVLPKDPLTKNTLIYQNHYDLKGKRTLYARNRGSAFFINPLSIPKEKIEKAKAIAVCPIDNNVDLLDIKKLRAKINREVLLACLPQGFFRRYKNNYQVYQANWQNAEKFVPYFDLIFISEEDGNGLNTKAKKWSEIRPSVIMTRAERGCSIFRNGKRADFPAFRVKRVTNPVGAGDVFAASFIHSYLLNKNLKKAAIFANKTAALHVALKI